MPSNANLGWMALDLLRRYRSTGSDGLIAICEDEHRAERLGAIIHAFEPNSGVMVLPALGPSAIEDVEASPEIAGRRSSVLRRLAERGGAFLIASADAIRRRVPPPDAMLNAALRLESGGVFAEDEVRSFLVGGGYLLDERIEAPGTAIFLGQALEVFPAGALQPVRIGYEAGRISDIYVYDLKDQRDLAPRDAVIIDVVHENEAAGDEAPHRRGRRCATATVFDYCSTTQIVVERGVEAQARRWSNRNDRSKHSLGLTRSEWERHVAAGGSVILPATPNMDTPTFFKDASPARSFRRFLSEQQQRGRSVIFAAATSRDLRAMDRRAGIRSTPCANWTEAVERAQPGRPVALLVDLDHGFESEDGAIVVAAADLLGSQAMHQDVMAVGIRKDIGGRILSEGDVVIHMNRGMAILRDLTVVSAAGAADAEMIRLEFADDDNALLPLSELRAIWRYSSDSDGVSLDKADGSSWPERRARAEADIAATAAHIAQRVAARDRLKVAPIVPAVGHYETFVAGFDYALTSDQARAISDVLKDLASDRPMDRLVCGDVGFGKTEVALRAAAAAVFAGKQAAISVPTTVLAQQHFDTFRQRFAPFGIEVGLLSRFASAAESRAVKNKLADGSLSVVIGTQALAAKGVGFKDLGLLVIDEEQHFGTAHKAKLAALADGLNCLTMTATPIPRTLGEVRAGLRSLSIIATAPVRRMPVKTIIEPFHEASVAAALRREHRRRGQSFLVCPRIEDIEPMAKRLQNLAPELRVIALHGKMPAAEIDAAMMHFAAGQADILLATNIIESGLDLPRANTIIVWRPEKFGLAQLHQLRGRVGRRSTRSFALFLSDPEAAPSGAAAKRLATLQKLTNQGAGFLISAGDMDLRGGGDLLSDKQSGHIQLLGSDLSAQLVDRALRRENLEQFLDRRPEVRLDIPTLLPATYVKDSALRLELYARLFRCSSTGQLEELEDEIEERFGELPQQARDLFGLLRCQIACMRLGITGIDAGPKSLAASFAEGQADLLPKRLDGDDKLEWKDGRLIYRRPGSAEERVNILDTFTAIVADAMAERR